MMTNTENNKSVCQDEPALPSMPTAAPDSTRRIMSTQLLLFCLPLAVGIAFLGIPAAKTAVLCLSVAAIAEIFCRKICKDNSPGSFSHSLILGIILALILPVSCPWYIPAAGTVIAVLVGKHCFGGMGGYIWHPSILALAIVLLLFPACLDRVRQNNDSLQSLCYMNGLEYVNSRPQIDCYLLEHLPPLKNLIWGDKNGVMIDSCRLLVILMSVYLIYRGYLHWQLPFFFVLTAYLAAAFLPVETRNAEGYATFIYLPFWAQSPAVGFTYVNYHIFTGGLLFVGCIIMGDITSRPMTKIGQIVFAAIGGVLVIALRLYTDMPLPDYVAILLMNSLVPLIDFITRPHPWHGQERRRQM